MRWINFLHFYQPANQQKDILEAVVNESYFPIFQKLNELDDVSISINISGSLLELFERDGYTELLDLIRAGVKEKKVELTGSCKYHALIPLIPEDEIYRQIKLNEETLTRVLGFDYKPKGFFPPEMAYHSKLNTVLKKLEYEWIIIDEIAGWDGSSYPEIGTFYKLQDTNINVFFRNRRLSNVIMSAVARDTLTFKKSLDESVNALYFVTGMDGETFGHHRVGFENFLFELLEDKSLGVSSATKLLKDTQINEIVSLSPQPSTWASSINDLEKNIQFLSWKDPENPIHAVQWEFLDFVLNLLYSYSKSESNYDVVRNKMDIALASDHFWWASAKPWWSLEMIEDGAYRFLDVLKSINGMSEETIFKGYRYYMDIVSKAAEWQREGIVRKMAQEQNKILRIPFKERTLGQGGTEEGVYWAFVDMMKEQEKKASKAGDYEKAILWRDAVYKLDKKYDIYDAISVIDLLRVELGNGPVEDTIARYKDEYDKIRGGQPEQRGS